MSPSRTARWTSSQEAICINRVVSFMLSPAYSSAVDRDSSLDSRRPSPSR